MDICFEGVGQVAATFKVDGKNTVQPGMAVTLTDYGTVGLGAEGDAPCGVLLGGVRGGAAAVQIGGVAKVGYTGTAPAAGWQELVCDGEGGVEAVVKAVAKAAVKTLAEGGEGDGDGKNGTDGESGGETAVSGLKCLVLAVDEDEESVVIKL